MLNLGSSPFPDIGSWALTDLTPVYHFKPPQPYFPLFFFP